MEGRLVFKNCALLRADGTAQEGRAVVVVGAHVQAVLEDAACPILPGDWGVPCAGRVLMPGRIDCHANLTGALLGPGRSAGSVAEVEALTAFALARAVRDGVTAVHEFLHYPQAVAEALQAQLRVARRLGVRLLTAHASSSKDVRGTPWEAQIEANASLLAPSSAEAVGGIALGWSDVGETSQMQRTWAAARRPAPSARLHWTQGERTLSLAEAEAEDLGLLGAHAVCARTTLDLEGTGTFRALLPGEAPWPETPGGQGLGSGDAGALQGACGRWSRMELATTALACTGPRTLAGRSFGGDFGEVTPGRVADLTLYDATLLEGTEAPRPSEVLRVLEARAAWVAVAGRVVMREGQLLGVDFLELAREASTVLRTRQVSP